MDTFHLGLSIKKSFTLCTMPSCGSLHFFPIYCRNKLLRRKLSRILIYGYYRFTLLLIRVLKCFDSPSSLPSKGRGEKKMLNRTRYVDLFRNNFWRPFQTPFVRTLSVQFSSVNISNRSQQWQHDPAETSRSLLNWHESVSTGANRIDWDNRSSLPCLLQGSKSSAKMGRSTKHRNASQAHLQCLLSPIFPLSKHHVSSPGSCLSKIPYESASARHHVRLYHLTSRNFYGSARFIRSSVSLPKHLYFVFFQVHGLFSLRFLATQGWDGFHLIEWPLIQILISSYHICATIEALYLQAGHHYRSKSLQLN